MPSKRTPKHSVDSLMKREPFPPAYWAALRRVVELEKQGLKRPPFEALAEHCRSEYGFVGSTSTVQNHYAKVRSECPTKS